MAYIWALPDIDFDSPLLHIPISSDNDIFVLSVIHTVRTSVQFRVRYTPIYYHQLSVGSIRVSLAILAVPPLEFFCDPKFCAT